jgi:hypothetical protein
LRIEPAVSSCLISIRITGEPANVGSMLVGCTRA